MTQTPLPAPERDEPGPAPRWGNGRVYRPAAAIIAGAALLLSFPPYGLWPLAPVGVAMLSLAIRGCRPRAGAGLGLLAGLTLFIPLLSWTGIQVGAWPWLLLATLQAAYCALLGVGIAVADPLLRRRPWLLPPVTALLWVGQEALRDRTPFGGFPWGRLAFSQGDSPLLRLAALGGAPLVTAVVALIGGLLVVVALRSAAVVVARRSGGRVRAAARGAAIALVGAAAVLAAGAAFPLHTPGGPTLTVAFVQGNVPRLGLDFNAQRRAVLDNHVNGTLDLARQVAAGTAPRPDLVVWPENSSDVDPTGDPEAAAQIDRAAQAVGVPILLGAVLDGPGTKVRNAALVWEPGRGITGTYVKRHPVPFAEYVPMRSVVRLVTDKVDLVRADFLAGTEPGILAAGPVTVGDVICFEFAYDGIVRDTVTGGAQLLAMQTNNATFTSAEASQQLAMARLRAVEHGRDGMMISTVGISAFVDARGGLAGVTGFNTAAVEVRTLHTGTGLTLATRFGAGVEYLLVFACIAALAAAVRIRVAGRRSGDSDKGAV